MLMGGLGKHKDKTQRGRVLGLTLLGAEHQQLFYWLQWACLREMLHYAVD